MRDLSVIIPYFNPCHWKTRLSNHLISLQELSKQGAIVHTIECTTDFFETDSNFKIHSNSILWQKERLINEVFTKLDTEYVAWVDSGLLFLDNNWVEGVCKLLRENDFVQLFGKLKHFNSDNTTFFTDNVSCIISSKGYPGGAWATRLDKIKQTGLYDANIIGGGDCIFFNGIFNRPTEQDVLHWAGYTEERKSHNREWKSKFLSIFPTSKLSYYNQECNHLYHGSFPDRKYYDRHSLLIKHNFNPYLDICITKGVWEWNSDKPELHKEVEKYFFDRNEDVT